MNKYIYAGKVSEVNSAAGIKGVLIRSGSKFSFRVYHHDDGAFTDYEIAHDDLSVTIEPDELASFYSDGEHFTLDHSPSVFDLKIVHEKDK